MEPTPLDERLQLLRERYFLMLGPLVLLLGAGLRSSPALAWSAGLLLLAATANKFLPLAR